MNTERSSRRRAASPAGPFDTGAATLVVDERLYSGRIIRNRQGELVLLAFENSTSDGHFVGSLCDPVPVRWGWGEPAISLLDRSAEPA